MMTVAEVVFDGVETCVFVAASEGFREGRGRSGNWGQGRGDIPERVSGTRLVGS